MGTSEFAAQVLSAVADEHEVVAVYTKPDAVRGRGKAKVPSPVSATATDLSLPLETPSTLRDAAEVERLAKYRPDAICVCAYGMILDDDVLRVPRYGCLNTHASLLPRWRGAAPIERAILAGDATTSVCIMKMEQSLDTGPVCITKETEIGAKGFEELSDELARLASQALLEALRLLPEGRLGWDAQCNEGVTYAEKIGKRELFLSRSDSVDLALRKVRASSDAHPSKCMVAGKTVTIIEARQAQEQGSADAVSLAPGEAACSQGKLLIGMQDGMIELTALKPDGKKAMDAKAFASGIQGIKGAILAWDEIDA